MVTWESGAGYRTKHEKYAKGWIKELRGQVWHRGRCVDSFLALDVYHGECSLSKAFEHRGGLLHFDTE